MSGSPQATIDTEFYGIKLYNTFRRRVHSGSDYFENKRKQFTDLFFNNKDAVDKMLKDEMLRYNNALNHFQFAIFENRKYAYQFASDNVLTKNNQNQTMHAIHIGMYFMTKHSIVPETKLFLMEKLFDLFNKDILAV